jgi:hypothetical protein
MRQIRHAVRVLWRRLRTAPFATAIGLIGINSGVNVLVRPEISPVHALLNPFDYMAALIYGIGGALIITGIAFARADVEASGCIAFAGGALIAATAWGALIGWGAWNQVLILIIFAGAAMQRAHHLVHGRVLVLVQVHENGDLPEVITDGD